MIVGIAGCTALLITAFGLYDSVCNVVNIQFDTIMKYDLKVTFDDSYKQQMIEDAAIDGVELTVVSAYRSVQKQQENLDSYIKRLMGEGYTADDMAADAGTCMHDIIASIGPRLERVYIQ